MFVGIINTPRPYAWGSTTAIAQLLGHAASGAPEAELWLGAHPGSPSVILDPTQTGGAADLAEWIAADPETTLGRFAASGRLPFLLKVLAAATPLSLQAHPTLEQARAGFDRENELGISRDAPERNYKDAFPKPELIYALSPTFDALCGFRPLDEVRALLRALIDASLGMEDPQPQPLEDLLDSLSGSDVALPETVEWVIGRRTGVATLVSLVTTLASRGVSGYGAEMATVSSLAGEYPGDPGIVISLLLNRVSLAAGEALYLPAGNIHAYLSGLGIELMSASDNVLRGGLTPKHIDVPELLSVLDFTPVEVPYLHSTSPSEGVAAFRPDGADFELLRIDGMFLDASVALTGPAIALCISGEVSISGAASSSSLALGDAVYITPDEAGLRFTGSGTVFVATTAA
ncbi:mannose-6-phosphate isomerase, class I [Glaciihabitans sp. GrIS 2.15]|uniref:mannose-6-phosphate isomerase, class I n=1 Tax=Glaciihabitans sp. GrIS 2.15 TaxID=3071710 RepID=UPI002DFE7A56|nr:mannose-6-phosphate isomerase [Glaciihabitans sp. GrIS 2.15]